MNDRPGGQPRRPGPDRPDARTDRSVRDRRTPIPRPSRRPPAVPRFPWTTIAVVALLLTLSMLAWAWLIGTNAVGVAIIEIPLLLLLTTPLFVRANRTETRFDLGGLLALGLIVRFAASYYRFTHASDGATYHFFGAKLAESYRHLDFGVDTGSPVPGTGGMKAITGIVEVFTNANSFATFLVFSWLGFFGCYLFYRAFVLALPDADHKRYALLVMLWPTLVFWPSSIGKDCWLLFTLGIASYGAARVYLRKPGGYTMLAIGLVLGALVRPHMSLMLAVAFGIGLLVGRRADRPGVVTPSAVGKVAGLVLLLALGGYLTTKTADLLDTQDINVTSALALNANRTDQGGSSFSAANPQNPIGYVQSAVTVMFRPFPFEAHGMEALMTSIEAMGLLVLAILSRKRLKSIPRRIRPEPYVTLACAYILMFFFAFGTIGNFGILARERSMMMPYVFVLLSLTVVAGRTTPKGRPPAAPATTRGGARLRPRSTR